jgi:2-oxoglutarate dehydrogenase E2 component (dihydrolipoamide succinyltransferase)
MNSLFEIRTPAEETEGTRSQVLRWLKAIGERVAVNEPLVELETDKVTVEIPAPVTGVLRQILKVVGEEVVPGELLGQIEPALAGTVTQDTRAAPDKPDAAQPRSDQSTVGAARQQLSPAVRRLLAEHALDITEVAGSGEGRRITAEDVLRAAAARPGKRQDSAAPGPALDSRRTWCRVFCIPHRT